MLNSKDFGVPQNRERCFIIGHLRGRSTAKVFPIEGADGKNSIQIIAHKNEYRRNTQVFGSDGITEALDTGQGGGRGHHVALPCFIDLSYKKTELTNKARCLQARYNKGIANHKAEVSGVAIDPLGVLRNVRTEYGKEVANTLDTSCNQGIFVQVSEELTVYAVWYEKYQCYIAIRKLTPKECFRLQGWSDDYFEKAQFVNSDSQLYKQAGNGVTVTVIETIARKMNVNLN